MAVPKRKTSKSKIRIRRRAHSREIISTVPCSYCGAYHVPHRVCKECGMYNGRQVLTIESEKK